MTPKLVIQTVSGTSYSLAPVPMNCLPSQVPEKWLLFQGAHVPGTTLDQATQTKIQRFMRKHHTECLTNGRQYFTLAGGMLAFCDPTPFSVENTSPEPDADLTSKDPCFEHGHWFVSEDGDLYIVPDDRHGIAETYGPDDETLEALNAFYRDISGQGGQDWFDLVDTERVCETLDLTFVHDWQRRFDSERGWYVA